ncbi:MAG: hypothetical protein ACE5ID_06205 [Acidobacteriota bacterium]
MNHLEEARGRVLKTLREIRHLIEQHDEPGVLERLNQEDAFCEAAHERQEKAPAARAAEIQCHFCEGYLQVGGCRALLEEVNRAVFRRDWDRAAKAVDGFMETVRKLDLSAGKTP